MRSFLLQTRESFWFLPAVFGIGAVILAQILIVLDNTLIDHGDHIAFIDSLSASAARSILTIIGTAMLTVAGTTFSITISVLATTSSTYGPRLVRNFLADRANQIVLAVFTSTFLYALVVLLAVRSQTDAGGGFVPTISIYVAVAIGVLDVAVLVFFIHHIADSVQITTQQRRVQTDLLRAIARIYPAVAPVSSTIQRTLTPSPTQDRSKLARMATWRTSISTVSNRGESTVHHRCGGDARYLHRHRRPPRARLPTPRRI